jgi:hypothetical protein
MEEPQLTPAPVPSSTALPGLFGTKIPSSVAFGIGVLLFFMPFLDIKCNSMILQTVTGVQLATGFEIKGPGSDNSVVGSFKKMDKDDSKVTRKGERNDPNMFALAALALGIIGLVLSLLEKKDAVTGGVIAGILAAVALIATLIDVKRKVKMDMPELGNKTRSSGATGFDKLGDSMYIAVDFSAWFYIAVIAFAAGAWFCYKRMQVNKMH